MIISEQQLILLVNILDHSLEYQMLGTCRFDHGTRHKLYNDIINQQSRKLIDIDDDNNEKTQLELLKSENEALHIRIKNQGDVLDNYLRILEDYKNQIKEMQLNEIQK